MLAQQTLDLLRQLIERPSITPDDAGCQRLIAQRLHANGFDISHLPFADVDNLWATHGSGAPLIVFAGHTDVVPPGDLKAWHSDPFTPTEKDGKLYGRGAADMKSGVAAMTVALETLVQRYPDHHGTLALLLTSDEEGIAINGSKAALEALSANGTNIDYAIVGEPSCKNVLGDTARNGRRGSLHLHLQVHGKEGHVAYPELVNNPIHAIATIASKLSQIQWDNGNADFPPTSFQISNINAGDGTENVVPASATLKANWRFNPEHSSQSLEQTAQQTIDAILQPLAMTADCQWRESAQPFATQNPALIQALSHAVSQHCQQNIEFNTAGGTSDARFFAQHGAASIEFGPCNATIHKANECVNIADLAPLTNIYIDTVHHLLNNDDTFS